MNGKQLHTALLENLFGPIRLHIIRQEEEMRLVHLYDINQISRTLGIVRFGNTSHPLIKDAHGDIVLGELLGKTLLERSIPYQKSIIFQHEVMLPEWLRKEFNSEISTSIANYSQITIQDDGEKSAFLYAEIFEIIPPDIIHLIPSPKKKVSVLEQELITLLGYAGITGVCNDSNI